MDYSKFDHIGSSDEDEDGSTRRRGAPNVVKLEGAHRITFGGGRNAVATPTEASMNLASAPSSAPSCTVSPVDAADEEVMISEREFARTPRRSARRRRRSNRRPPRSTVIGADGERLERGDETTDAQRWVRARGWRGEYRAVFLVSRRQGGDAERRAPPGTPRRDVRVRVTATDVEVVVTSSDSGSNASSSAFREAWTHEIDPEPRDDAADADAGAGVAPTFGDWEITDFEGTGADARRVVRVTVRKKGADMLAHWWRSGVKGGPEVDPRRSSIEARPRRPRRDARGTSARNVSRAREKSPTDRGGRARCHARRGRRVVATLL